MSRAARASAVDFYFHSVRLVGANLAWGVLLLALLAAASFWHPMVALVLTPVLAVPAAGIFRLGALLARGEHPDFSDATDAWREHWRRSLAVGAAISAAVVVLAVDLVAALGAGGPSGWAMATLAAWGLVGVGAFGLMAFAVLADPWRDGEGVAARLRLAALVLLAAPGRMAALLIFTTGILVISTLAFAALLSVSVAYLALVAGRAILPIADRLDVPSGRNAHVDPGHTGG